MKVSILALAVGLALPTCPTHANVVRVDTGITEVFGGVTYELLEDTIGMLPSQFPDRGGNVTSNAPLWIPVGTPPIVVTPPLSPIIVMPPPLSVTPPPSIELSPPGGWNPPVVIAPPCDECGFDKPPPVVAVPEISTWLMMLMGFAGLGVAASRSARRSARATN